MHLFFLSTCKLCNRESFIPRSRNRWLISLWTLFTIEFVFFTHNVLSNSVTVFAGSNCHDLGFIFTLYREKAMHNYFIP